MSIKILHCIYRLHGGGAERQLTLLANHLNGKGLEFAVFCVDDSMNNINNDNCKLLKISVPENYPWHMVREIGQAIIRYKPDIVHTWLPPSVSAPALLAAKLRRLPTVASYRNKKIFESWIRVPEYMSTLLLADGIISNNRPEQSSYLFRRLYYAKTHALIPNAVLVPSKYVEQRNTRTKNNLFKLLFVGRLTHQKNWQVLLKALAQLVNAYDLWELSICGQGEDKQRILTMASELGLSNNIKMLGYRKDVFSIMSQSDLMVLPSWYEGMPNVVLEAMSMGLPTIVSRISAHTELFGEESGISYFDPNDVTDLSKQLINAISNQTDLTGMSVKGKNFTRRFTPHIMLEKYQYFYEGLLA